MAENINKVKKSFCAKVGIFAISMVFVLILFCLAPGESFAWIGRMDNQASSVIGQVNFDAVEANQGKAVGPDTLSRPRGVWEGDGRLAVSDWMSHRVLIYNTIPTANNPSADVVIGQQNFTSSSSNQGGSVEANTLSQPGGLSGGGGKFLVSDNANNRILVFNGLPTANNTSADLVIGQPDFTSNSYTSPTASSMSIPEDVWTNGQKVIVADRSNNRVLIWNSMPTTNGQPADAVVGQPDFTSNLINQGGAAAANTLNLPNGIASDGTKLFIADSSNSRVLIYNQIPTSNNVAADVVVGQPNFTDTSVNQGLAHPEAYTLGGDGSPQRIYSEGVRLYVCDKGNQRILIYNTIPTENNASADAVFGQPDFVSSGINTGPGGISSPRSIFAGSTKFYVTDRGYNRVLVFKLAPEDTSILINNGASTTNEHNVMLTLTAVGAKEMIISNNASFSGANWEPYATSEEWDLASGNSIKTVYAKFRDYAQFESATISASIDLPSTPVKLPETGSSPVRNSTPQIFIIAGIFVAISLFCYLIRKKHKI